MEQVKPMGPTGASTPSPDTPNLRLSRWHKLLGGQSRLATGTDEHGLKIQRAAEAAHLSPQQHANATSASFKTLWDRLGIKYDYYTRTTQSHHHTAVQSMLSKIRSNGHIREGRYEGLYCVPCEAYYTELDPTNARFTTNPSNG